MNIPLRMVMRSWRNIVLRVLRNGWLQILPISFLNNRLRERLCNRRRNRQDNCGDKWLGSGSNIRFNTLPKVRLNIVRNNWLRNHG